MRHTNMQHSSGYRSRTEAATRRGQVASASHLQPPDLFSGEVRRAGNLPRIRSDTPFLIALLSRDITDPLSRSQARSSARMRIRTKISVNLKPNDSVVPLGRNNASSRFRMPKLRPNVGSASRGSTLCMLTLTKALRIRLKKTSYRIPMFEGE